MEHERKGAIEKFVEDTDKKWVFPALKSTGNNKGSFQATLKFDNYMELMFTIRNLLKVSLHTLYNDDSENAGGIAYPSRTLESVLEIALQLLPMEEFKIVDAWHELHLKLEELEKERQASG